MTKIERLLTPAEHQRGADLVVFDFSDPQQTALWLPINDVVMGGVSLGTMMQHTATSALFSGIVSLEHGGGFASVRTLAAEYNLGGFAGLTVVARGDGKRYKLNLTTYGSADDVLFQARFGTMPDQWIAVTIPFQDFVPTFRGRPLPDHSPLNTNRIQTFGLMISEGQAGEFELEVGSIAANT
jgi:monofunctional biosynthetic peptidoglycan transglycosylase